MQRAHCHGFISRLPEGYDTVIGEEGLSQGQKQLISIARVMLCLPPVLILDEATSNIDTRTEMKIQKAFYELTDGKTSFMVAHRLSTIRSADLILVMRDGNVVEQGTHTELLDKKVSIRGCTTASLKNNCEICESRLQARPKSYTIKTKTKVVSVLTIIY